MIIQHLSDPEVSQDARSEAGRAGGRGGIHLLGAREAEEERRRFLRATQAGERACQALQPAVVKGCVPRLARAGLTVLVQRSPSPSPRKYI
jgi:hypothetical protein